MAATFSVTEFGAHRDEAAGAFMDTAAILVNLDLVVSSDTSLVHLAGGLGVPIWMALPWAADWRWLLERNDSPWYPTMRLFRQARLGEWDYVFQRIAMDLSKLVERRRGRGRLMLPVSPEELIDEIESIVARLENQETEERAARLRGRLARLSDVYRRNVVETDDVKTLRAKLRSIHQTIWQAEKKLRYDGVHASNGGSMELVGGAGLPFGR